MNLDVIPHGSDFIVASQATVSACDADAGTTTLAHRQPVRITAMGYLGKTGHVVSYQGQFMYRVHVNEAGIELSFHLSELVPIRAPGKVSA